MIIRAQNLSLSRGDVPVLAGVSLSLDAGECLLLRGPNGSGKTSLLRALAGLMEPDAGTCEIDLEDVTYAGHLDAVKAQLSVSENLDFWAALYRTGTTAAVIESFQLADLKNHPAAHLSAGQRRRLGLARVALINRPIWLMDEPTAALDAASAAIITQVIADHCLGGGVAVVATHLDIPVPGAKTLDVSRFKAADTAEISDPFIEGAF